MLSNKIYDFDQICEDVKQIGSDIRFAGIINEKGRLIAGGMKKDLIPLASKRDDEMLYMELALRVKMRQEFDKQLGKVNFAMAVRGSSLEMSFPIGDSDILYVMGEPSADYGNIPKAVFKIINKE